MTRRKESSSRTKATAIATRSSIGDFTKTKRFPGIPTSGVMVSLPEKVDCITIRNSGLIPVRIQINSSGSDFFTIVSGLLLEKIPVRGAVISVAGVGGLGELEIIFES